MLSDELLASENVFCFVELEEPKLFRKQDFPCNENIQNLFKCSVHHSYNSFCCVCCSEDELDDSRHVETG